jgi:hypothetical protein
VYATNVQYTKKWQHSSSHVFVIPTLNGGECSTPRRDVCISDEAFSLSTVPVLVHRTQSQGEYTGKFTSCIVDDGQSQWPRGLRRWPAAALLQGIRVRIPPGNGCLSLESVICCRVDSWQLVQRNLNECGASECDHEAWTVRKSWTTGGCCADEDTSATKYKARLIRIWEIWDFNRGVVGWAVTDVCDILVSWSSRVTSPRSLMTVSNRIFHLFNNNISCTFDHSSFFPNIYCYLKFKLSLPTFNIYYFYPCIVWH